MDTPKFEQSKEHAAAPGSGPDGASAAGVSISRRRALIKGLGKGAAIAGASAPITVLAGERLALVRGNANYICTISGNMSLMLSGTAGQTIVPCTGEQATSYVATGTTPAQASTNWPSAAVTAGVLPGKSFADCFGLTTSTDRTRLTMVTLLSRSPLSDEGYWACALLNAYNSRVRYPYTPSEVKEHYKSGRTGALQFHKMVAKYV